MEQNEKKKILIALLIQKGITVEAIQDKELHELEQMHLELLYAGNGEMSEIVLNPNVRQNNVKSIKGAKDNLEKLKNEKYALESKHGALMEVTNYLNDTEETDLKNIHAQLEKEIISLEKSLNKYKKILSALEKHSNVQTKDELLKLDFFSKISKINYDITVMEKQVQIMYELFNICPECLDKKTVYDWKGASGDPYAKSWEYQIPCSVCKGTGHYHSKNKK